MIKSKKISAFTLVELIVVVAIIALIASIASISLTTARRGAKDKNTVAKVLEFQSSLEAYRMIEGEYPEDWRITPGLELKNNESNIFLDEIPFDLEYHRVGEYDSYEISFYLQGPYDDLSAGYNCAIPQGLLSGECGGSAPIQTYVITFNANGGDGGHTPSQSLPYDIPTRLTPNGFTRAGYSFAGWNTLANGNGLDYADRSYYTIGEGNVTLYAKWEEEIITYLVNYNGNGSTSGTVPPSQNKVHGSNLTLAFNTGSLARAGYTFAGWNTEASGSGANYSVGSTYTEDSDLTLYAKWEALLDEGGIITTFGDYIVHTFLSSGTYVANSNHEVDVLVVAGGGGGGSGGSSGGGGGGAGGLIYTSSHSISPGSISVVVGSGGAGGIRSVSPQYGLKGGNSSFASIVATGGGGGAYSGEGTVELASGGSGGGGAGWTSGNNPGTGISGQGNNGGSGYSNNNANRAGAGGGGGSSAVGANGSSANGGNGGAGTNYSSIFGTTYGASGVFAGGGGGSGYTTSGNGSAGGGNGRYNGAGYNASANTGSGGGGGGGNFSGGAGGSGIVIIRYLNPNL